MAKRGRKGGKGRRGGAAPGMGHYRKPASAAQRKRLKKIQVLAEAGLINPKYAKKIDARD